MKEEGVAPESASEYAIYGAIPMAALDTASVGPVITRLGGADEVKRQVARGIARRIAAEAGKGGARESFTEMAQEAVKEATVSIAADKPFWTVETGKNLLEAGAAAFLPGSAVGGISGVRADQVEATSRSPTAPPPVEISPEVATTLTAEDAASPIAQVLGPDVILEGRQIVKDAAEGKPASATAVTAELLPEAMPTTGTAPVSRARRPDTEIPTTQPAPARSTVVAAPPPVASPPPAPAAPALDRQVPAAAPAVAETPKTLLSDGDVFGDVERQIEFRKNGQPWLTAAEATLASRARPDLRGRSLEPVRVEGGWALGVTAGDRVQESAADASDPGGKLRLGATQPDHQAVLRAPTSGEGHAVQGTAPRISTGTGPADRPPLRESSGRLGAVTAEGVASQLGPDKAVVEVPEGPPVSEAAALAEAGVTDLDGALGDLEPITGPLAAAAHPRQAPNGPRYHGKKVAIADTPVQFDGQPFPQARVRAQEWAMKNVRGDHRNADTGWTISVPATGIKKATTGTRTYRDLDVVAHLPKLLEGAVHVDAAAPRSPEQGVKAYHTLYGAFSHKGKLHRVRLTVREMTNGRFFYDQHSAEIENAGNEEPRRPERGAASEDVEPTARSAGVQDGPTRSEPGAEVTTSDSMDPVGTSGKAPRTELSVEDLLQGVNLEDGRSAVPDRSGERGFIHLFGPRPKRERKGTPGQRRAISKVIADRADETLQRVRDTMDHLREQATDGFMWAIPDEFHALRKIGKQLQPEARDGQLGAYVAARLARHPAGQVEAWLREGAPKWDGDDGRVDIDDDIPGFYEIVAPIFKKGLADEFEGYAYARRVKTQKLIEQGREHNLTAADVEELLGYERAHPEFKTAFDEIQRFKKAVLDTVEGMGLINADQRATWEQADHVPFYRSVEDKKRSGPSRRRALGNQSPQIRKLTGGEITYAVVEEASGEVIERFPRRDQAKLEAQRRGQGFKVQEMGQPVAGIIENIARNVSHLMDAAMKNHAAQLAIDEAIAAGWAEKVPMQQGQVLVPQSVMKAALERIGHSVKGNPEGVAAVSAIMSPVHPGSNVVAIRRDGNVEYYEVHDRFLFKALGGLHQARMHWITKALSVVKMVFTRTTTATPTFMAKNFDRDTLAAWIQTEHRSLNPLTEIVASAKEIGLHLKDPALRAVMAAGGDTGWYKNAPEDVVKYLRRLERNGKGSIFTLADPRRWLEQWEKVGRAVELSNRMRTYKKTLEATGSKREATFEAMDVLDFQLRGGHEVTQFFMAVIPFLNAQTQGLYKLGRAGMSKSNRKKFLTKGAILATFSTALALLNADDEDYNDKPTWEKIAFWHIPLHRLYGKEIAEKTALPMFLMIPKPFELGFIFGTIPELVVGSLNRTTTGREVRQALWLTLVSTFGANPVGNPASKEIIEQVTNYDFFTDREIISETLQRRPRPQQFDASTPETAKKVGEATGASPLRIQHAVEGFLGAFGTTMLAASDAALDWLYDVPANPHRRLDERPVLKSFMKQAPAKTTKWVNEYYDTRRTVEQILAGIKEHERAGDFTAADALRDKNTKLLDWHDSPEAEADADRLAQISREMRDIRADRTMTAGEKRKALDALFAERNAVTKTAAKEARQ